MKASVITHPNIAFVKYWGKKDVENSIPTRDNCSMTLSDLITHTTVEFSKDFEKDSVTLNEKEQAGKQYDEVVRQVDRMRKYKNTGERVKIVSINNFPTAAGIASSAAGFSALAVAINEALQLNLNERELSRAAGFVSGSAARSIKGGFVRWRSGDTRDESFAEQVHDERYWDLRDIITIVDPDKKKVSSREGMALSKDNCPIYNDFVKGGLVNTEEVIKGLAEKDFRRVGEALELDSFMLHSAMMTTKPALLYWSPATIQIMKEVISWREEGLLAYHTIDAGPNVHIITTAENAREAEKRARDIPGVTNTLHCGPGGGPEITKSHLF